jgi:hypothetical protein
MKLHDVRVTSSPRETKIFGGLNVGNDQKWHFQHLDPMFMQLFTGKKSCLMYRFIRGILGFTPDEVIRFDGTL